MATAVKAILGRKLGMTQAFDEQGRLQALTAIEAGPCYVTQIKTPSKDGYSSVQIGFLEQKKLNSAEKGHLKPVGKQLKHIREFRVVDATSFAVGQNLDAGIFDKGEKVDVVGTSKGKGFAGGVKRYHFRGGPKTHGQSDRQRAPGSVGGTTSPGRVFKGTRMAGHMGASRVTVRNVEVAQADPGRNLIVLKGAVPGPAGSVLLIRKSAKRRT
jgi:large subunit ribosomal protein L3